MSAVEFALLALLSAAVLGLLASTIGRLKKTRVLIAEVPAEGDPPYAHLLPIVQVLVRHGNSPIAHSSLVPTGPCGFYMDKDGWICELRDRLDVGLINRHFRLPSTIRLDPRGKRLDCHRTWVTIVGGQN